MKTRILVLLLICCGITGCTGQSISSIPPADFASRIDATPDAQILDVRSPEEYNGQHLKNAVNYNWNSPDFAASASKLDKSKPVFVYCLAGVRSKQASEKLEEMGFSEIYDLHGGMMKWNAAGLGNAADKEKLIGICPQEYGDLIKSGEKVLVNFYAEWCEPCKKMKPYMMKLADQYKGKLVVSRLNADEHKTIVAELKIDALPVIILYENQKIVWQHSGYISEEDLKKHLQ